MIEAGIFHFPVATKQGGILLAHTDAAIDETIATTSEVIRQL